MVFCAWPMSSMNIPCMFISHAIISVMLKSQSLFQSSAALYHTASSVSPQSWRNATVSNATVANAPCVCSGFGFLIECWPIGRIFFKQPKHMQLPHYSLQNLVICERLNVIYYMYHIYTKWHCLFKLCWSLHFNLYLQRSLNSTYKFNLTAISKEGQANTAESSGLKLIHPINEEWALMLIRVDKETGHLFFFLLLLKLASAVVK